MAKSFTARDALQWAIAVTVCLLLFVVAGAAEERNGAGPGAAPASAQGEDVMHDHAKHDHATGTFDVKVAPETIAGKTPDPAMGQMSLTKTWAGDIVATSTGSMLTGGDYKTGQAGYVAMEKVTGTLKSRKGSFILMHTATMNGGTNALNISVVPGSATDDLKGLSGQLTIRIEGGQHYYDFDYTLP